MQNGNDGDQYGSSWFSRELAVGASQQQVARIHPRADPVSGLKTKGYVWPRYGSLRGCRLTAGANLGGNTGIVSRPNQGTRVFLIQEVP